MSPLAGNRFRTWAGVIVVILAIVAAFILAGCGSDRTEQQNTVEQETQSVQHAHEMKDVAIRLTTEIRENRAFNREQHQVLVRLLDKMDQRPCMMAEYQPHPTPKPAASTELPQPPTERTTGRA